MDDPMYRPDLADITVRNTTAGSSHGKLEPMPKHARPWINSAIGMFFWLVLLGFGVLAWYAFEGIGV